MEILHFSMLKIVKKKKRPYNQEITEFILYLCGNYSHVSRDRGKNIISLHSIVICIYIKND